MSEPFVINPAGDAALTLALPPRLDPMVNAWCVDVAAAISGSLGAAVRDVVVGFCTVTVYFDPLRTDGRWLEGELSRLAAAPRREAAAAGALLEIPVCYGGDLGPDLERVAGRHGCSEAEVIERHAGAEYRVYMLGFVPGFAYMGVVDETIATPRLETPRARVPAGSVGIADRQTGIYPADTPGGWNLIGRTPVRPFDAARTPPFLFAPGDRVRFRPVSEPEFRTLAESPCAPSA